MSNIRFTPPKRTYALQIEVSALGQQAKPPDISGTPP
jgi:hypothetical protein